MLRNVVKLMNLLLRDMIELMKLSMSKFMLKDVVELMNLMLRDC